MPWEALLHVKNKKKKEQKSKKEKKKNTMTIVKKECGKTKVEKRAQEVLGHQNGHVTVEKRAQEVLGQTTAMRWVEKEQKRKVKMKKTNSAALVLLLLWCLPCLCSAQGALAATNDTSPVGSPATGATVAVPWDGGTASPVVLNSNFSRNSGFLDGVINGIIPLYVSLNPPKFVWVVVFITSAFSSIWLGGLQQFIRKKHKRSVKRQAAKQRKAVKRTHADFAPNHHRRMCFSSKFVPCRYAGRSRLKSARVTCRRLAAARYLIRRSWTHLAGKSFHHVSPSVRRVPHFTPSQVDLLRSDVLSGGAGASAAARRQKKRNQDNSQTRKLLKDLKVCFNQGGSVPDLLNLLSVFVNQVSTPKKKKVRRSSKNPVKGSDNAKSHVESPPVVRYWKDSSGKSWPYTVDRNGWWSWVSGSSSGSTSVPAGSASAPVSSIRQKASSWVSSLRPLDWSPAVPPKLVPFGRIKQCLQQGEKINGNLVEIWSPDHIRELQTLWDVYSQPSILTAMLCGSAKDFEGVLHTRVSLVRGQSGTTLENVGLLQISKDRGPWVHQAVSVPMEKVPQVQRVTVRVAAPFNFRIPFLSDPTKPDSATFIIETLASLASKPVADFLGARWSQQDKQGISQLVAFLRLKPDVATKLVSLSGSKGLFISRVDPKNPSVEKPFWVPRNASESDETYHRRVCSLQVQRQQPVIHRFGKTGDTLGFLRRPDDPEVDNRIRALTISSVPRAWGSEDLSTFLAGVGWTNLEHLTRRGKRWYGRAKPPDDHFRQSSWQYQVQLSDAQPAWSIHVQVSVPGPRQLPVSWNIQAPRHLRSVVGSVGPDASPMKLDSGEGTVQPGASQPPPAAENAGPAAAGGDPPATPNQENSPRERTPRRGSSVAVTALDSQTQSTQAEAAASGSSRRWYGVHSPSRPDPPQAKKIRTLEPGDNHIIDPDTAVHHNWKKFDQGGNGDCFFRALSIFELSAAALAQNPTEEQSKNSGAWLRSQAVLHAQKHADRYGQLFSSKAEFEKWLKENAQPTHWCNGPIAQATSEKIGRPIVVWRKKENVWERYVIAGRFSKGYACANKRKPPAVLILADRHYVALVPPEGQSVPTSWLKETVDVVIDLSGAGRSTSSDATPSVHTVCSASASSSSSQRKRKHHDLQSDGTPSVHTLSELVSSHVRTGPSVQPDAAASPRRQQLIRIWGQKQRNHTIAENERQWTCPHCAMVVTAAASGRALSRARTNHLSSRHPGVHTPKIFSIRANVADHVDASAAVPLSERCWSCPFCKCGLPAGINNHVRKSAITRHYAKKHPRKDTGVAAVHAARAKQYRKSKDLQPHLKQGKASLSFKLSREANSIPLDTGNHSLVVLRPDWKSWPARGNAEKTRAGTLMTCTQCLRISNAAWDQECRGTDAGASSATRSLWDRLSKHSPKNVAIFLKTWKLTSEQVAERFSTTKSTIAAAKAGHHVVAFRPHAPTWPGTLDCRTLHTCTRCLRISSGGWDVACKGDSFTNVSKLRLRWKEIRDSGKNCKLLCAIWGKTKSQVDSLLSFDPNKGRRIGEASNPGPFRITSLNVGGAPGCWRALQHFASAQTDVLVLQEIRMKPNEWPSFLRKASSLGFIGYAQHGPSRRNNGCHQPCFNGGVAVLARKKLHQVQVFSSSKENSQLLVVAVAGLHVGTAYAPPDRGPALADLTSLAAEYFVSNPNHHAQPFLFAGDFNEEADDCQLVEFLAPYCGHVLASGRPTRWEGQREVDYFVTNRPHHLSSVVVELVQLSDHVPISVTWCPPTSESFKGILTQTPDFSIPSGLSSDIWRKTLSDSWTSNAEVSDFISNLPEIPDVQSEWDCFQALLNSVFRRAFSVVAENCDLPDTATTDAAHRLQRPGRKGVVARFKKLQWSHRGPELDITPFHLRHKRKRLARLSELKRLHLLGIRSESSVYRALLHKLDISNPGILDMVRELDQLHHDINHATEQLKRRRLASWRQCMTQDIRSVSRWLHSKSQSNVFSVTNPQGRRSESLSEAAAFIHQYWVDFWQNHHTPPEDQITAHLRQGLPTIHPTEFPDLETEHVISIFRKQRGSAGPDGWSGSELSHLPDAAIELFVKLAQRWEIVGRAPLQMRQARMATLPKPGKSENGSISVQSTRPITVLNTFWRIWNSSKIAHLSFQLWIRQHIPGEIAARRGSSISGVAAQIIEDFAVNGYLLSLDWSKCFDTFSAACSAQLMRDFGLPVGWSNVCQDVWVNQQRWVCFQGCVHGTPLTAPHSIPQGDPLGPILCMLWTTCGHNSVRRAVPVDGRPARTVLYMDDRSVTSSSAESLSHHKHAWSQWSGHVGLIENESKVSLAVKSPKLPVPALLAPFVQSTVRVLGAYTAVARRRMCPDEEQRLAKASQTISLLASIQLPFRVFHQYVAMFAMPQASYGWVSRLPTVAAASRLWSSVRRGDGKCFMANKHIRALFLGGNSHLEVLAVKHLLGAVAGSVDRSLARWNGPPGSPVRTLRQALKDLGFSSRRPWVFSHQVSQNLNLIQPCRTKSDRDHLSHILRHAWRATQWERFLNSGRHEAQEIKQSLTDHWSAFRRLDIEASRNWILSSSQSRTMGLSSFVSSHWLHLSSGICEPCVWGCGENHPGFFHLAWSCPLRPDPFDPPPSILLSRFGWSSSGDDPVVVEKVRQNLSNLCETIWQHRYGGTGRRAAATGVV